MGAKWERSKRWDDQHIPAALWPVKAVLRLFSSVYFGVSLLVLVGIYGVLASIPIGMLALLPTNFIYALTCMLTMALFAGVPLAALWYAGLRKSPRAVRFVVVFLGGLALCVSGALAWNQFLWPMLHYVPATGEGFRLFAPFCQRYQATTLRRLPGMEMTELEFYSWWPLRLVLLLFVTNMVVSTIRRIEFSFHNVGVLTVHTGIVTIACGSIFYSGLKKEGDTILLSGIAEADGTPTMGPPQSRFYDNTLVSLYLNQHDAWEQRALSNIPRYNDYNLSIGQADTASAAAGFRPVWQVEDDAALAREAETASTRALNIPVESSPVGLVDPDLKFRVVGYAQYAEATQDWLKVDPKSITTVREGMSINPLRIVDLYDLRTDAMKQLAQQNPDAAATLAPGEAKPKTIAESKPVFAFMLLPQLPAQRVSDNRMIAVEYTIGMPEQRWSDLSEQVPDGTRHALVIEVPGKNFRQVLPVQVGTKTALGQTGYAIEVKQLEKDPPFPIITAGYKGATSSVAVVRITGPDGAAFERWVYHRFPEISQDMLDEKNERGMPKRRDADPAIRITYIDADQMQIYLDEQPGATATTRAIVREPGGKVRRVNDLGAAGIELVPFVQLVVSERWTHAEAFPRPRPVPASKRDRQSIGTHDRAMLGVEISTDKAPWKRVAWVPYVKYLGIQQDVERVVDLPDGRRLKLAFGRRQHRLPGFSVQLIDFQMLAYDHRGSPRDYQSIVRVSSTGESVGRGGPVEFETFDHVTKLNAPLRAPFHWDDSKLWARNFFGQLASGLNPNQYKFSQAGWDASGWQQTQAMTDQGQLKRPRASFTILGVGNNPGIHVIALGAILMGVGIPWAFYVKPWLIRREKARIQQQLKDGTYVKPGKQRVTVAASSTNSDTNSGPAGETSQANEPVSSSR